MLGESSNNTQVSPVSESPTLLPHFWSGQFRLVALLYCTIFPPLHSWMHKGRKKRSNSVQFRFYLRGRWKASGREEGKIYTKMSLGTNCGFHLPSSWLLCPWKRVGSLIGKLRPTVLEAASVQVAVSCFENYSVGQVASYYLLRENGLKGDTLHILEDFLFVFETRSKH